MKNLPDNAEIMLKLFYDVSGMIAPLSHLCLRDIGSLEIREFRNACRFRCFLGKVGLVRACEKRDYENRRREYCCKFFHDVFPLL